VERWTFDESGNAKDIAVYEGALHGRPLQENGAETEERLDQLGLSRTR
jgi:hypothetical protein